MLALPDYGYTGCYNYVFMNGYNSLLYFSVLYTVSTVNDLKTFRAYSLPYCKI